MSGKAMTRSRGRTPEGEEMWIVTGEDGAVLAVTLRGDERAAWDAAVANTPGLRGGREERIERLWERGLRAVRCRVAVLPPLAGTDEQEEGGDGA